MLEGVWCGVETAKRPVGCGAGCQQSVGLQYCRLDHEVPEVVLLRRLGVVMYNLGKPSARSRSGG